MGTGHTKPTTRTAAEEVAARDAVMKVPPFPDLERMLIRAFGPGAEAIMLHQLVYWFRKPTMKDRGWLYKTFDEWWNERGLRRRHIDKGRASLKKARIIEEHYGSYKRIHYRVDWVRLAGRLNLTLNPIAHAENGHKPHRNAGEPSEDGGNSVQSLELHTPDTDYSAYLSGEPSENGENGVQSLELHAPKTATNRIPIRVNPSENGENGVQSNTGDYAGDYLQESYLYRGDADGSSNHRTPPPSEEIIEEGKGSGEPLKDHEAAPSKPDPTSEKLDPATVGKVCDLLWKPDTDTGRLASRCVEDEHITSWQVAEAVAHRLDRTPDMADRYLATVEDALEILKKDVGKVAV